MGAVGLNFGNPTSGTGFDVTTTVNEIVSNLQAVETPWKTQLSSLEAQDAVFTSLGTDLSNLTTDLAALTDPTGVLAEKEGSSSDTDVLTLTSSSSSAVAGTHTVVVTSLATTASYYSDPIASASDVLTGSFTVTVDGTAHTISTDSGGDTLTALESIINSADAGVSATVVNGESGPELSLVSNTSGAAGNFTISGTLTDTTNGNATINLDNVGQTGADAALTVDGIQVTSASNTVTDAIQGVTFQLLQASPGTSVQVVITNDNSDVESAVSTFVSDYNTVITALNAQEGDDSSGNAEPLYGNPTVSTLQQQLQQALIYTQPAQAVGTTSAIAATDTLSGSLTISVGGSSPVTVAVGDGGTAATPAGLAAAINNANLGVTASVITSGTAATLSLANATSGSSGAITVDASGLTDATTGEAVDFSASQSNAVTSITQLGISVNSDGTLSLDTDTLDSLLDSNYQDVANFLQASGVYTSFGGNLTTVLGNLGTSAPDGAIYLAQQYNQTQESDLNTNISDEQSSISTEQQTLTTELNTANQELEAIPTQLDEINELYSAITGYNENGSGS
jgi:flagellar hook-associated protein 2